VPLAAPLPPAAFTDFSRPGAKYHHSWRWPLLAAQNAPIARVVARAGPRVALLDVELATNLRPDGHGNLHNRTWPPPVDCLHYKLAGPLEHWVRLFFAALEVGDE